MPRRPAIALLAASVLVALGAGLSGCTVPEPAPSETPAVTPSETASSAPTETAAPPDSTPVTLGCEQLISAQTMYDFNPNFSLLGGWAPEPGSAAATAVDASGVACRWQNNTSGDAIDVSVAELDEASLKTLANQAYASSTMVPTYGDEAYFAVTDGVGEAIVFDGSYWVVLRSPYFFEPGDATPLVESVLSALG